MKKAKLVFTEENNAASTVKADVYDAVKSNEEKRLNESIDKVKNVLFATKTLFPFDLFPDDVVIDLERLSIRKHMFFKSEESLTYEISDIYGFTVEYGPVSSTIRLQFSRIRQSEVLIRHLSHTDAATMKELITGILKAKKEHIDLIKIDQHVLYDKIEELGKVYG